MNRVHSFILALLIAAAPSCGGIDEDATGPHPSESVVQVLGEFCRRDAQGSGVIIDDDLVLTSAHVLAGSEGGLRARRPGTEAVPATLVSIDPDRDLALLVAPGIGGSVAVRGLADSATAGVIGTVNADGHLELLAYSVDRPITANSGDIYDEGEVTRSALQLSADTLPGDSGGALFDSANRVVGIVFAQSRSLGGVAYALAMSEVNAFLNGADTSKEVPAGRCR